MGTPTQRYWSADSVDRPMLDFYPSAVEFINLSWVNTLASGETISASGVTAFATWFLPAGFSAYASGTGTGAQIHWVKFSATGTVINQIGRASARILSTSGRQLFESWDMRIYTGA